MSTFKGYLTTCKYGTQEILCDTVTRESGNRIARYGTPGTDGEELQHMGAPSVTDSVTALMTIAEVTSFKQLIRKRKPQTWAHPLLFSFEGYVENFSIEGTGELDGYFRVNFTVIAALDRNVTTLPPPVSFTLPGKKAQAKGNWDDLSAAVGDLPDWDGGTTPYTVSDQNSAAFDSAWSDLGDGWTDLEQAFDAVDAGTTAWSDLARAVDGFNDLGEGFIDAARDVEDFLGDVAVDIQTYPRLIVEAGRDAVEAVREDVKNIATLVTVEPTDLYTMMLDTLGEIDDAVVEQLLISNKIDNPFVIHPGVTVSIPLE